MEPHSSPSPLPYDRRLLTFAVLTLNSASILPLLSTFPRSLAALSLPLSSVAISSYPPRRAASSPLPPHPGLPMRRPVADIAQVLRWRSSGAEPASGAPVMVLWNRDEDANTSASCARCTVPLCCYAPAVTDQNMLGTAGHLGAPELWPGWCSNAAPTRQTVTVAQVNGWNNLTLPSSPPTT